MCSLPNKTASSSCLAVLTRPFHEAMLPSAHATSPDQEKQPSLYICLLDMGPIDLDRAQTAKSMWIWLCWMAQPVTFPGIHSEDGHQQPGHYRLESLFVISLALAGHHQLGHGLGSQLAPRICGFCLNTLLGACCCGLQRCLSEPGTACE